jgi:hypothetical protein
MLAKAKFVSQFFFCYSSFPLPALDVSGTIFKINQNMNLYKIMV